MSNGIAREELEVDIAIVGAGPAGLAAAIRLISEARKRGVAEPSVAVIEKAPEIGAHSLSGAVMDPRGLDALIPDWRDRDAPVDGPVTGESMLFLTSKRHFAVPFIPSSMRHHGAVIISIQRLVAWLGARAEELGVDLFPGFSASNLLVDDGRVVGIRTGDRGIDRKGEQKSNFEPGYDILARVTMLAEGVRGTLTQQLVRDFNLDEGRNPQLFAGGAKEIWKLPEGRVAGGRVLHTLGWPLPAHTFGGAFCYEMSGGHVSLGLVAGLDSPDPTLDVHGKLQELKTHPYFRALLEGGELVSYGAKAIPEGGYWALPTLVADGAMLLGDSAGMVNAMRLKGIHLAIESGVLAADTALSALAENDVSRARLMAYDRAARDGSIGQELYRVRNFRQAYQGGLLRGMLHTGLQMVTGGRGVRERYGAEEDHHRTLRIRPEQRGRAAATFDGELTFDKMTDLYRSGTRHEENQPAHLVVIDPDLCRGRCAEEFGNPCESFCPAGVYEMVAEGGDSRRLHLNGSNCVHCKICDIADPYGIIVWTAPEGGDGPRYSLT